MPKRKNNRWEQIVTRENCLAAVKEVLSNRHLPAYNSRLHTPNRRDIERIVAARVKRGRKRSGYLTYCREHPEEIAEKVYEDLKNGTWRPTPYRTKIIYDKLRGKYRFLKMPCLYDQFIHHAVLRVMIPDLQKRFDYHSCGSIPKAGQKRATVLLQRELGKTGSRLPKYGGSIDVYHFYETCSMDVVMYCLERVYKDKKLLEINRTILNSMGGTLAIGFFPSPWYANLVLDILVDKPLKAKFRRDVRFVRYADDISLLGRVKRKLHRAVRFVEAQLEMANMHLKANHQVYPVRRGIAFLTYRFFPHCSLIRKQILYRITRTAGKITNGISPDLARRLCSYKGIMQLANSRTVWTRYFQRTTWQKCRRVIRYVDVLCREAEQGMLHQAA